MRIFMNHNFILKLMFISILFLFIFQYLDAVVRIYVEEPQYRIVYGESMTVSIKIEGLEQPLRAYQIGVSFDTNYLDISDDSSFHESTLLSNAGETKWLVSGSNGEYSATCSLMGVTPGTLEPGTLFTVLLTAKNVSTGITGTNIHLGDIILRDVLNNVIDADLVENTNIEIESAYTQNFSISLSMGWNLISAPMLPQNADMTAVFTELIASNKLIKVQDERAFALVKNYAGVWINNIGNFEIDEGYYVKVNSACVLNMTGYAVALPVDIVLQAGWNIISFPGTVSQSAMSILQPLINANQLVKVQDETAATIVKNLSGYWVDNIGNFEPCEGYYIKVNTNTHIVFTGVGKCMSGVDPINIGDNFILNNQKSQKK